MDLKPLYKKRQVLLKELDKAKEKEARDKIRADQNNPLLLNIMRLEGGVTWVHNDGKTLVLPEQRIYTFAV